MADDLSALHETLALHSKVQLQIVATLHQHGRLLAEIHQMVSPPDVKSDEPGLRELLSKILETLERQAVALEVLAEQQAGFDASHPSSGSLQ